jgi:malonyl-CoA/methylmalonyl-CoA synthetase
VDIIKRGGYKISALHIESALLEHPEVAEAAVLGLPDEVYGEKIVAMIAVKQVSGGQGQQAEQTQGQQQTQQPGQQQQQQQQQLAGPSDEELRSFCQARLPLYQVPQAIIRVPAIPRNAMGKVNKKQLIRELLQG